MHEATASAAHRHHPLWAKVLVGFVVFVALLALLLVFFPWDVLRGPLNRYVSDRTGRHFEITRRLDVKLGRTTRVLADGLVFANPDWAKDPQLVQAESAEVQVELLPLLHRRVHLPLVSLHKPQLGLQVEADGRRSWALGRESGDPKNIPQIDALVVDEGTAHVIVTAHGADIHTDFAIEQQGAPAPVVGSADAQAAQLPLSFKARGTWQNEPFTAQGRTGNVLYLGKSQQKPFPMQVDAAAGGTTLKANGAVTSLATFEGLDAEFNLQGPDLSTLYKLVGVVLPATPGYSLRGHLERTGNVWHARGLNGKLGNSDLAGNLDFDRERNVPHLTGTVQSKLLDFNDLAPMVGLPVPTRTAATTPEAAPVKTQAKKAARDTTAKVLPTASIDLQRLRAMTADVNYSAASITHAHQLPLDRISVQVKLADSVLRLDPMKLGVAGGTLAGNVIVNGKTDPAIAEAHLDVRALELNRLFPKVKVTQANFGKIHGDIDLKGRGNSVAKMLGTSSGNVVFLMGKGQISNLLMEFAGLDGGEIIKFMVRGDKDVKLRCAAAAFDVKEGLMASRALVLDTDDTIIYGDGAVSLANETMDLTLRPYPKDMSILAFRSPLKLGGSFAAPKAGVDKAALAGKAGAALALGAINPLLALAATIETGPGKDANCGQVLREAASPDLQARVAIMSREQEMKGSGPMGAPGSDAKRPTFLQRLFGPRRPREEQPPATQR